MAPKTPVIPDGVYWIQQNGEVVGQLASQGGTEYWFLYPTYDTPGPNNSPVQITLILEGPPPVPFSPSVPPLGVVPTGTAAVVGGGGDGQDQGYSFLPALPSSGVQSHQVDPQFLSGYFDVTLTSIVAAANTDNKAKAGDHLARLVVLLTSTGPTVTGEHWFVAHDAKIVPTSVGDEWTVTLTWTPVPNATWWDSANLVFDAGGFHKSLSRHAHTLAQCSGPPVAAVKPGQSKRDS
jgi:hypothetical protein